MSATQSTLPLPVPSIRPLRIAEMPSDEQPETRLLSHGPHTLSDGELAAIVLETETLDEARALTADGLRALHHTDWRAAGKTKAQRKLHARPMASLELARRVVALSDVERDPVLDPVGIARSLVARYSHFQQERLGVVFLDAQNRPIREREVYIGTVNATTVSTRDVLRLAIAESAVSIILFHNHPSGDPAPSADDILFTRKMVEAANLLGIEVLDHIVIGDNGLQMKKLLWKPHLG